MLGSPPSAFSRAPTPPTPTPAPSLDTEAQAQEAASHGRGNSGSWGGHDPTLGAQQPFAFLLSCPPLQSHPLSPELGSPPSTPPHWALRPALAVRPHLPRPGLPKPGLCLHRAPGRALGSCLMLTGLLDLLPPCSFPRQPLYLPTSPCGQHVLLFAEHASLHFPVCLCPPGSPSRPTSLANSYLSFNTQLEDQP